MAMARFEAQISGGTMGGGGGGEKTFSGTAENLCLFTDRSQA